MNPTRYFIVVVFAATLGACAAVMTAPPNIFLGPHGEAAPARAEAPAAAPRSHAPS